MTNQKTLSKKTLLAAAIASLLALALSGCASTEVSNRPRTAFEQLLLSTALDEALEGVELPELNGERVYVDGRYLSSYDEPYALGSIRALLSRNGALLQDDRDEASIIVEPRSGALGIDHSDSLVGLPSVPLPIPAVGTVETPQLSLYSSDKKDSVAKLALLAYRRDGSPLFTREGLIGKSYLHQYKILLLVNVNRTNIPARQDY